MLSPGNLEQKGGNLSGIQFAITVSPSERLQLSAIIKSWCPQMKLDLNVWHPDLSDIMYLIENKLECGDEAAYIYNVSRWQRLVDSLVKQSLLSVDSMISRRVQQLSAIVFCLFLTNTLIYPTICISLDVIALLFGGLSYIYLRRRQQELLRFIAGQEITFKERVLEFGKAFQASIVDREQNE